MVRIFIRQTILPFIPQLSIQNGLPLMWTTALRSPQPYVTGRDRCDSLPSRTNPPLNVSIGAIKQLIYNEFLLQAVAFGCVRSQTC